MEILTIIKFLPYAAIGVFALLWSIERRRARFYIKKKQELEQRLRASTARQKAIMQVKKLDSAQVERELAEYYRGEDK